MRTLFRIIRWVVLLAILAVLIVIGGLATLPGKALLAGFIERAASGNGLTVSIDSLTGWPPFSAGATRIVLSDADGPFAEIDNAALTPRLLPLLTGNLAFQTITAERVAVERQPNLPGGGGEGALLPFAAEDVAVSRLELGAALTGRPAVLALTGSYIGGRDGSLSASVDAQRIDGVTGSLQATATRADAAAPLALDLRLTEAGDGILVGLMGRDSGPGYTLTAKTGYDGTAFDGDVSLVSDGRAHFDGRFTLTPAADGQHLVLSGAGDLAELVPPDYAGFLSGQIDIAVDATWATVTGDPLPQLTIRQGTIATSAVRATASGSLTTTAANLDVSLDVTPPAGTSMPLPGAPVPSRVGSLALTGTVRPAGESVRLDLTGRATNVVAGDTSVPNLGVSLAVEADQSDPLATTSLPFALRLEADAVETPAGRVTATASAPLVLSADGTYDTETQSADTRADLSAAGAHVTFAGSVSAAGASGRAEATVDDLATLAPIAGRPLSGALRATADGTFGAASDFAIDATAVNLDTGDPTVARLLGGTTQASGNIRLAEDGAAAVSNLRLTAPSVQATANGSLSRDAVELTLDGGIDDLAALAEGSSGAATFTARVSGAPSRPDIDATVRVPNGQLLNQPIEEAVVRFEGAPDETGWRGALTLAGGFAGTPLTGTATAMLDRADNLLSLPAVDLTIGGNRITGAITRTAAGPLSGTLRVDAPDLRTLAAFMLVQATGSGSADLTFTPDGARQTIAATFDGQNVAMDSVAAGRISGSATIMDAFGAPQISGTATASSVNAGGLQLNTVQANATVAGGATQFQATARGRDIDLTGRGALSGAAGAQVVRIDALNGTAFRFPVALSQPVTISLAGGRSELSGATLALGGGTIRLDGTVSPALNLTVTITNVAASVINTFAPDLGAEGTITGRATVTGSTSAPQIAWEANWAGLRTLATRNAGLPGLAVAARGTATMTATSLTATLTGAGLNLAIDGTVPFAGANLNVRAQGTAPLALLALESNRELRLGGNARVNLTVTGSLSSPRIAGTVDLADAVMADTQSGFGVVGANGRIAFDGQRATVQTITGRLTQGGDIVVTGGITIGSAGLPADLTVRVTNGRYSDGTMISTTFNANLAVTGPLLGGGLISGSVALGRTEIQLPERMGGSGAAIQVTHVNAPPGFVPPMPRYSPRGGGGGAPAGGGGGGLRLDVSLSGPSGIFVRGFGIDAELGGSLRLIGTTGNPQAAGGFEMVRGRIEVIGRRFDFTRGTLTFEGSLVPRIDFAATTTTSDAVVTLNVTGPANDPDVHFSSVPDLPEEEIVSRLLFNQSVGRLSPIQALQLVDAVAQLTGAVGSGGILGRIRAATGLDDLDIRQTATGGTTIGIGRRINERLRVGLEGGTEAGSGRVTIDLDITPNLKAEAQAGQDGQSRIGLTYEREY